MPEALEIEAIFKEYKDKIYRLALSIARNDQDAQDIVQSTLLKIMQNLAQFRNEARLSTWIYKIAYNEALTLLRKKKRDNPKKNTLGLFINWAKLPDEQLLDSELKERVDNLIKQMPIKYRMPLLLDNVECLALKESALILGLNLNSLKTRLHRAHLMVKSGLLDYFKDREEQEIRQDKRCSILTRFISDYAQGALARTKQTAFNRHIEDCPNCNSFLDIYLKAIRITKALECQDLPRELQTKIEIFLFKKH